VTNLKFRAWDKEEKVMIPAIHIFVNGTGVIWENKRKGLEDIDSLVATEKFELMQFTGRKDISGTEVYENDILGDTEGYVRGTVVWDENELTWVIKRNCCDCDKSCVDYLQDMSSEDIEVIGNLYEIPELLKS
jgi:uncharacterized phage protein (TIGR01671 family)